MQIRRALVVVCGMLSIIAVMPTLAQAAAGVPTITSVTPNEVGSAGGFKVIIKGTNFEELSVFKFGTVPATKIILTGTPTKGQCKIKSSTELECITPFHEHGCIHINMANTAGTSAETAADTLCFLTEVYRNEVAVGAAKVPDVGYGQMQLESPQINTTIECVNVGFGAGWNVADATGEAVHGHGEILSWWANGHTPTAEHAELSSACRFIYHGTTEEMPPRPGEIAWASAEPPLKLVIQEGIVCLDTRKPKLSECPNESEREGHETVVREVSREPPSLPWNIQFTEKAGALHVQIGLPEECKGKTFNELSQCPEPSEREPSKTPEPCDIPPTPDPPGCVKVQILSNPPLNVHMEYEGYLEPLDLNSGPNGLSPSSWEFEGHRKAEPSLHLRETPSTEGSTTGNVRILGFSGQELMTAK